MKKFAIFAIATLVVFNPTVTNAVKETTTYDMTKEPTQYDLDTQVCLIFFFKCALF
jgi:hypothetical protein